MFSVCVVCAIFCVFMQVEALRGADHPLTEVKRKVSSRRPRPELGCRAKGKKTNAI
jgi:hypothetical protein